jgi:5-methylcytosine-specific restriction protein B
MSRVSHHDNTELLAAAEKWRDQCLLKNGSIFGEEDVWGVDQFSELTERFIDNPDLSRASFYEKLASQLEQASALTKHLAAEILWVLFLFPTNLKVDTKRVSISKVWGWSGTPLSREHWALAEPVLRGIGSGGMSFTSGFHREFSYAIRALGSLNALPESERAPLLANGYKLAEWLDRHEGWGAPSARHTLLYVLFPDEFERIASGAHKRKIAKFFGKSLNIPYTPDNQISLDHALQEIRKRLEQASPDKPMDFYFPPWKEQWNPDEEDMGEGGDGEDAEKRAPTMQEFQPPYVTSGPSNLNQILYGPPGTGKTFATKRLAVEICDGTAPDNRDDVLHRFEALRTVNRIEFVTFHQSFSYEDFVEGLRPVLDAGSGGDGKTTTSIQYECRPGVFRRICSAARSATEITGKQAQGFDLADRRMFKMSLGDTQLSSEAYIYPECIDKGYVLLGYGEGLDFTGCKNRDEVMERLKQVKPDIASNDYAISSVAYLMFEVKRGDLILVSDGNTQFRAIGEVIGDYEWLDREDHYRQKRAVRWLRVFEESQPVDLIFGKRLSQMTLYLLDQHSLKREALQALIAPAKQDSSALNHVLIIDEINRANISKVFGELITLLEPDKRLGAGEEIRVRLPYSHQEFGVPGNLYVIGTMNSADHSIALLDTALRRRFVFKELRAEPLLLKGADQRGMIQDDDGSQINLRLLLQALNERIEFLRGRDQQIGHAYLMGVKDFEDLKDVFSNQIIPLLQEHFYEDWAGMAKVLAVPTKVSPFVIAKRTQATDLFGQIDDDYGRFKDEATIYTLAPELTGAMFRGLYAHMNAGG